MGPCFVVKKIVLKQVGGKPLKKNSESSYLYGRRKSGDSEWEHLVINFRLPFKLWSFEIC